MYRGMREVVSDIIVVASSACLAARVIRGSFCISVRPINAVNVLRPPFDGGAPLESRKPPGFRLGVTFRKACKEIRANIRGEYWRRFGLERRNFAGHVSPASVICSRTSGARDNLPWARAKCSAHEAPLRLRKNAPRRVVLMTWSHTCPTLRCPGCRAIVSL